MSAYRTVYEEIARHALHDRVGFREIWSKNDPEEALWPLIYRRHYLRERHIAAPPASGAPMRELESPEFAAELAAANRSTGILESGWRVIGSEGGQFQCEKDGLSLCVPAALMQPGAPVTIRFPAERRYWMPFFYCIGGGLSVEPSLRVYFNVKPGCAAWLLRTLSEEFEKSGAAYQFKVLNHPAHYTRPDAAVLYVGADRLDGCRAIVKHIAAAGTSAFRVSVPSLARRIHPGIAVADEPPAIGGQRVSFGEHRCRVIAKGLALARANACVDVAQTVECIAQAFALEGLTSERPYASTGAHSLAGDF
jgi:HopA1 effector protein family